jgi:hypothetical protein
MILLHRHGPLNMNTDTDVDTVTDIVTTRIWTHKYFLSDYVKLLQIVRVRDILYSCRNIDVNYLLNSTAYVHNCICELYYIFT